MKNILIILTMIFATSTYASIPFTVPNDQIQLGQGKAVIESNTATVMSHKVEKMIHGTGTPTNLIKEFDIGSANNPYLGYDNDAGSLVFSNDGILQKKIGSGSGGGAGGFSVLANGGFDDGIDVNWSCTGATCSEAANPLFGEQSLQFTGTATGDVLQSDLYDLADPDAPANGLFGNACEGRVYYIGGDGKMQLKAVDGNGDDLGQPVTLPEHKQGNYESIYFRCPTETPTTALNSIRLEVEALDATATATFDDMYLGQTIGLVTIVDAEVEEKILSADVSSNTDVAELQFENLIIGETYQLLGNVCIESSSGNTGFEYRSSASGAGDLYGRTYLGNSNAATVSPCFGVSFTFVATSDTLYTYKKDGSENIAGNGTKEETYLQLRRLVERQVFKNIPRVADNENVFSAKISATGVVSNENVDWISGDCPKGGTGLYTCNFITNTFELTPNCSIQLSEAANTFAAKTSASNSSISWRSTDSTGSFFDRDHEIICQKHGTDYKTPTVQLALVNQVVTNSGDPVKICRLFQVSDSATPSYESPDDCYKTLSRTGTGQHTFEFKDGYFKSGSSASCWALVVDDGALQGDISIESAGAIGKVPVDSPFDVQVYSTNGASSVDRGFNLICLGDA